MENSAPRTRRLVRGGIALAVLIVALALLGSRITPRPAARATERRSEAQASLDDRALAARRKEAPEAPPATRPVAPPVDVPTAAELAAGVVGTAKPGEIVVRRTTWDVARARVGLPPVDPGLVELEDLPGESPEQAADPDAHQLYVFDHEISRASLLADHEDLEGTRFGVDANDTPPGSPDRQKLELAASEHAGLAHSYRERAQGLAAERARFVDSLSHDPREAR